MQAGQDITVGGRLSRTEYQYTLTDTDIDELNHWAPIFSSSRWPSCRGCRTWPPISRSRRPMSRSRSTATQAARLGISPQLIDDTLYDAFGSRVVGNIFTSTNQYWIILEVLPQFQTDANSLAKLYVVAPAARTCRSSTFAHFTTKVESLAVNHQGQFPAVTLSFNLAPGTALGEAVDRINAMRDQLKAPATLEGTFQGTAQAFQAIAELDAAPGRGRHPRRLHRARHAL